MNRKSAIWGGIMIGSFVGGLIPSLWGAGTFSMSGVVLSAVGSLAGIWVGYRFSE